MRLNCCPKTISTRLPFSPSETVLTHDTIVSKLNNIPSPTNELRPTRVDYLANHLALPISSYFITCYVFSFGIIKSVIILLQRRNADGSDMKRFGAVMKNTIIIL